MLPGDQDWRREEGQAWWCLQAAATCSPGSSGSSLQESQGLLGRPPKGAGLRSILFSSVSLLEEWGFASLFCEVL